MTPVKFDVTMLTGDHPDDPIAVIDIDDGVYVCLMAYVYRSGTARLYVPSAHLTATDLRRLADTIDAIHAGTYQHTPTYAEICDTARELRQATS